MTTSATPWKIATAVFAAGLAGALVFFLGIGQRAGTSTDGRHRLPLSVVERDFVLNEMRGLLATSRTILQATLDNDFKTVAEVARKAGMADVQAIPPEIRGPLMGKLPLEFKQLGFSVHEGMDAIALDAEGLGDRDHTLRQLAELQGKCVACHAAYTLLPITPTQ